MIMPDYEDDNDNEPPAGAITTPTRGGQLARRDFGGTTLALTNPMTEALAAQERAMVEARYIMAMRRPRDLDDVSMRILAECKRPGFAEVATYSRPVGKQLNEATGQWEDAFAEGLSIRFAEVALRWMGNMSCTSRVIHDDPAVRMIQVIAIDYETGGSWDTMITVAKTVERKKLKKGQRPLGERENSYGDRVFIVSANDQEVAVKAAAEISKASRTLILRIVPGDIQDDAFELCKRTAADSSAKDPAAAKKRMLTGFSEVGVRPPDIVQWLGHPIEQGTREQFQELSRILSALRERDLVWSDVLAERLAARAKPTPAANTSPASPAATAEPQQSAAPSGTAAGFVAAATASPPAQSKPAPASNGKVGKGTDALKGALRKNGGAKPAGDPREAEPSWMANSGDPERVIPVSEVPPEDRPADGNELRRCATEGCTATLEVPSANSPGQRCYACTAADRDTE